MQVTHSDDVIHCQAQRTHDRIMHQSLNVFNLNLHPVCAVNVLLNNEKKFGIFLQTVGLASNNFKNIKDKKQGPFTKLANILVLL